MFIIEILLVLGVLLAIGYPLIASQPTLETVKEGDEYHKLLYDKDAAFIALKDLEFDYKTDKLDEEDYRKLKKQYENEAVVIYKKLDAMEGSKPVTTTAEVKRSECPACGREVSAEDKFCSGCGGNLG